MASGLAKLAMFATSNRHADCLSNGTSFAEHSSGFEHLQWSRSLRVFRLMSAYVDIFGVDVS